jgi:ubiquinone/menaquinone biosynthesis C-methylase UbiE
MDQTTYDQFKGRYGTDADAETYRDQRFRRSRRWRRIDEAEQRIVAEFLARRGRDAWVLDLPCGTGRLAPLFAAAGVRHAGADIALPMLNLARQSLGPTAPLAAADALAMPFADGAFDAVVSVRLFHRITERDGRVRMLREMARVSRGGAILATYYLRHNLRGLRKMLAGKYAGLSRADLREDARAAGLRLVRITSLGRLTEQQCFAEFAAE